MAKHSARVRALLFLYSNANIAGCALALLGPALMFLGLIGPGWVFITAGLYAAGWLVGRSVGKAPEIERRIATDLSVADMLAHLDRIVETAKPHLPPELHARLISIEQAAADVLPRLAGAEAGNGHLFVIRETVLRYLPETLSNYVALPPAYRTSRVVRDGKTARALLAEQLKLLDESMHDIVGNVVDADAQGLVANGKFLEAKFKHDDFLAA